MKRAMVISAMSLWCALAAAEETATGKDSQEAKAAATATGTATTPDTAKAKARFKLPPGFYEKKFGKHQLYCKKDAPMGTRLKSERCLNDKQMREYLLALEQQKTDIDRVRATCSTASVCSNP